MSTYRGGTNGCTSWWIQMGNLLVHVNSPDYVAVSNSLCWYLSSQGLSDLCQLNLAWIKYSLPKASWEPWGIIPFCLCVCIASHCEETSPVVVHTGCQRITPRNISGALRPSIPERYTLFTPARANVKPAYGRNGLYREREAPVFLGLPGCGGVCVRVSICVPPYK